MTRWVALLCLIAWPDRTPRQAADVPDLSPRAAARARFTTTVRVNGEAVPVPDGALLTGGDRVRIDWFGPAGDTLASWVSADGQAAWRESATRTAWTAPHADLVVRAITGGTVDLGAAMALLAGDPAGLGTLVDARWRPDGSVHTTWRGAVDSVAVFDAAGRPVRATSWDRLGRPVSIARWRWSEHLIGVEIAAPRTDTVVSLTFQPWLVGDPPANAFDLVPAGFSAARLEAWR